MVEATVTKPHRLRCAIYTRKSSDDGLEQEFNSLHAQREACEAYIASQRHEGWRALAAHYDDGGFSGGTMDRPGLSRLLYDIGARKVDVVVVYKIDRLTRSLFDFVKIVEAFDAKGVSFVSVTQQLNTTSSMGRLTLNVLLSFAQFEREVTGERIRDKIAASKRKGMWMGGFVPFGYDVVDRKLRINRQEAETVRRIFTIYLELGNVRKVQEACADLELKSRARVLSNGRTSGGGAYIGRICHGKLSYEGEHEAIIDVPTLDRVQAKLAENAGRKRGGANSAHPSLLAGLLFTAEGVPLTPSHAVNHGRRYRYYVERPASMEQSAKQGNSDRTQDTGEDISKGKGWRLPAHQIENLVLEQLEGFLKDRAAILDALHHDQRSADVVSAALLRASTLAAQYESSSPAKRAEIVAMLVKRVNISRDKVMIELKRERLAAQLTPGKDSSLPEVGRLESVVLRAPVSFRRRGVETKVLVGDKEAPPRPDPGSLALLARAHAWLEMLIDSDASCLSDIAEAEGVNRTYVVRVLCLAFLAPEITKGIAEGRQPDELSSGQLLGRSLKVPLSWRDQISLAWCAGNSDPQDYASENCKL